MAFNHQENVDGIAYTPIQHVVKKENSKQSVAIKIGMGAVIIALAFVVVNQFMKMRALNDPERSAAQMQAEADDVKAKVEKLMQLPEESATVATVQDASKLAGQEFFKNVQNGDKVLIFPEEKKAVIYRESENRIINSGPITINATATAGGGVV